MLFCNKSDRVQTSDALWRSGRLIVPELSFIWRSSMFLMQFCPNSGYFAKLQLVCDGPTNEKTVGETHSLLEMRIKKHGGHTL